jgi:hypothetical protein
VNAPDGGSMSNTIMSGRSSRGVRISAGWNSIAAWFPSHDRVRRSSHTMYRTSRPADSARIVTVAIHSGVCFGASFW